MNISEEIEEVILSNAIREENTYLKPPWTKLKGKKENIRGTFKDKEIHLVHKLCMHDAVMLYDLKYQIICVPQILINEQNSNLLTK